MKKLKKKEKIIIGAVAVLAVAVLIIAAVLPGNDQKNAPAVETTPLSKGNLQKTVSATGVIESTSTEQVSSTMNYPVSEIYVSVGNWVSEGESLCELHNENAGKTTSDTMMGSGDASDSEWIYIKAPVSGTITSINTQNGALASGVLFTIENTNSLQIRATIKEADLATVKTSMPVNIKTDATGDTVYQGTVKSIAPTAVQSQSANAAAGVSGASSGSNPEFQAIVSIDSDITNLLIGMKARLSIIVEDKQDVYSVDYNAVTTDAQGDPCILAAVDEQDGIYTVKEIPVTTGTESDFAIEISGDGLSDGLQVITDISNVKAGDSVTLKQISTEDTTNGQ